MKTLRVIISGGGTGGHIFPAIAIANEVRSKLPDAEILFVGAEGRMEMQRVPAAGYRIEGLPVAGFDRKRLWRNFGVLIRLWRSQRKAQRIIKEFQPQVAVGVGGYASGPTLNVCGKMGIPTLLQEQNSYAGVTNKLLAKRAQRICVAYDKMERFFPADRILLTGNPVRQNLLHPTLSQAEARRALGLRPDVKTILVIGGSLGARTLNESVLSERSLLEAHPEVQVLWQTGSYYKEAIAESLKTEGHPDNLVVTDFVTDMSAAYTAADLVISRAGASSISELALLGKPSILVPSPNVAEDHQTHNALALVEKDAALYVKDSEAYDELMPLALKTVGDEAQLEKLSHNVRQLAHPDAASRIADEVIRLAEAAQGAQ